MEQGARLAVGGDGRVPTVIRTPTTTWNSFPSTKAPAMCAGATGCRDLQPFAHATRHAAGPVIDEEGDVFLAVATAHSLELDWPCTDAPEGRRYNGQLELCRVAPNGTVTSTIEHSCDVTQSGTEPPAYRASAGGFVPLAGGGVVASVSHESGGLNFGSV